MAAAIEFGERPRLKKAMRRLAPFFFGALAALALAPFYFLPLFAVGLSALILRLDQRASEARPIRGALLDGWLFGFGYFLVGVYWMAFSFFVQAESFAWMAPFAMLGMPAFLACFYAGACALSVRFWCAGWARICLFAAIFCAFEYARGHILTGLPWNLPGQALAGTAVGAQSAAYIGVYGLSVIVVFLSAAPALRVEQWSTWRAYTPGIVVLVAGFAALIALGAVRLSLPEAKAENPPLVRIVQPNIPQREKIDPALRARNFHRLLDLSSGGLPTDRRVYVIWPENAMPILNEELGALSQIENALPANAVLLAGGVRRARDEMGDLRYYNSIFVAPQTPEGRRVVDAYDKHHLVPFGEYLPLQGLLRAIGLAQLAPYEDGFSPGSGPRVMSAGGPSFSPLICYEAIFPGAIHPRDQRPAWLLAVTNDAWFGDTSGPRQHLDQARLRSIETGLPMARSANTGVSALIDSKGRMRARANLYTRARIDAPLPAAAKPTLYSRLGDKVYFAMTLLLLGLTIVLRRKILTR